MSFDQSPWRILYLAVLLSLGPACFNLALGQEAAGQEGGAPAAAQAAPAADGSTTEAPSVPGGQEKPAAPVKAAPPPPPILQPYRVEVRLSVSTDPTFQGAFEEHLLNAVGKEIQSRFRQMWDVSVVSTRGSRRIEAPQLASLTESDVHDEFLGTGLDKIFLMGLVRSGGEYRMTCREWDGNSRTLGPLMLQSTADRRELATGIVQLLADAFRPIAYGEVLEEGRVDFLIRGGEFLAADPAVSQAEVGDYFVPYMRYLDRSREVKQIQLFPWTYLKVESVDRSRVRLNYISTFRFPFSGTRRRVEVMAIRVKPRFDATELKIYPRKNYLNPLVGYRCEILDRLPTEEDPVEERLKLITDRRGIVTIPADPSSPQKFLMVYSGEALLARIPLVVGVERYQELEVPDDRARLNVEGEVALLKGELIDIVATREVIMARARSAAEKKDWQKVDLFIKDLEELPTQQSFLARIDSLRVQAEYRAQQLKDRVQENRVKKLCAEIAEQANKHLDPVRIIDFRQQMREERGS